MSKFNIPTLRKAAATSPISAAAATGRTYEGAPGYARDPKGELFLLAVTNMVGEDTFYESAAGRDARFRSLVRTLAVTDPDWTTRLIGWLRTGAQAAECVADRRCGIRLGPAGCRHWPVEIER